MQHIYFNKLSKAVYFNISYLSMGTYAGNHNDLFDIIPQFQGLVAWCKAAGIKLKGVRLNMGGGKFDYKKLRSFCFRHGIIPNVKENPRNRKKPKPVPKRLFDEKAYKNRFVCERTWA